MTDYYLGVVPQSVEWELRANVARFASPMGGVTRTLERVGSRWACTFKWDVLFDKDAARIRSFLASQRGGANRFWFTDPAYSMRGSYSAPEVLTSSDLSTTTSWSTAGTSVILTAADNTIRVTNTAYGANPQARQSSLTTVQYAPYATQGVVQSGKGATPSFVVFMNDGVSAPQSSARTNGKGTVAAVVEAATCDFGPAGYNSLSGPAGDYFDMTYASAARCALVDNGANALVRSDEFDNAAWSKTNLTISANAVPAPDGTMTMDAATENVAVGVQHFVQQSAARASTDEDLCGYIVAVRGAGTRDINLIVDDGASNGGSALFNLTTGAVSGVGALGTATRVRAFSVDMGSGRYACYVIARCPATVTMRTLAAFYNGSTTTYTGDGTSVIYFWRGGVARSGVPTKGVQTMASAFATGASQTGSALNLKGLPASTNGLLYAGDLVEIITPTYSELKRVTAPLNSDAAGLGYLQFEPILRQSPDDNAAVIIRKPMCRMLLDESTVKTQHTPAGFMSVSFTAVEDVAV